MQVGSGTVHTNSGLEQVGFGLEHLDWGFELFGSGLEHGECGLMHADSELAPALRSHSRYSNVKLWTAFARENTEVTVLNPSVIPSNSTVACWSASVEESRTETPC